MKRVPITIEFVDELWPDWVGARVQGRTIYWKKSIPLNEYNLAHELCHVTQRELFGWRFLFVYLIGFVRGGFTYKNNPLEVEAREASSDPFYLRWARDVIKTMNAQRMMRSVN